MRGSNDSRCLASKTRATASGFSASQPSPYTVSVGNATRPPLLDHLSASLIDSSLAAETTRSVGIMVFLLRQVRAIESRRCRCWWIFSCMPPRYPSWRGISSVRITLCVEQQILELLGRFGWIGQSGAVGDSCCTYGDCRQPVIAKRNRIWFLFFELCMSRQSR